MSVALTGDTVVVGAPDEDSNVHSIFNGAENPAQAPLSEYETNGNPAWRNVNRVSSADNYPEQQVSSGAVYVYVRTGTTWTRQARTVYLRFLASAPCSLPAIC